MSKLVFCETTGWWATKFRQICQDVNLPTEEIRFLEDLKTFAASDADALIAIEIKADNIAEAATIVQRINAARSPCRCVALIQRDLESCKSMIRGVGFIDVFAAPIELPRLARLTRRHVSLLPEQTEAAQRLLH